MKQLISLIITILFSTAFYVEAKIVGDVKISDSITFKNKSLKSQGAGVRSKFFIDLYVASFFSEKIINSKRLSSTESYEVVNSRSLKAIRLNIVSDLISSEKMLDSINTGFKIATDDNKAIAVYITEFTSIFDQPIEKKDQFTFISEPGVGVHILKNNQRITTINNDDFRQVLLSIWLGPNPIDDDLKRDMLGNSFVDS
jgi:hypothetical protein